MDVRYVMDVCKDVNVPKVRDIYRDVRVYSSS